MVGWYGKKAVDGFMQRNIP